MHCSFTSQRPTTLNNIHIKKIRRVFSKHIIRLQSTVQRCQWPVLVRKLNQGYLADIYTKFVSVPSGNRDDWFDFTRLTSYPENDVQSRVAFAGEINEVMVICFIENFYSVSEMYHLRWAIIFPLWPRTYTLILLWLQMANHLTVRGYHREQCWRSI